MFNNKLCFFGLIQKLENQKKKMFNFIKVKMLLN